MHLDTSAHEAPKSASESARNPVDADAIGPGIGPTGDVVEAALAKALEAAAAAGRFDVVAQLAHELQARRLAREPNVLRPADLSPILPDFTRNERSGPAGTSDRVERNTQLAARKEQVTTPVALPAPRPSSGARRELDRVFKADPARLRQELLGFFAHGQVLLPPQPDGAHVAVSTLLALVALAEMKEPAIRRSRARTRARPVVRVPSSSSDCCAGAMGALYTGVSLGFERRIAGERPAP